MEKTKFSKKSLANNEGGQKLADDKKDYKSVQNKKINGNNTFGDDSVIANTPMMEHTLQNSQLSPEKKHFIKRKLVTTDKKSDKKSPIPAFVKIGSLSGPGSKKSIQKNSGRKKLFSIRKGEGDRSDRSHRNSSGNPRVNAFNPK